MHSRSLARVVIAGLAVPVVLTLGCGKPPSAPSEPPTPTPTVTPGPEASTSQRLAALSLFDAASVHAFLTTSLLSYGTDYGKVLGPTSPCSSGSMEASLDGGVTPTPGTFLPTGSHTYVVSFSKCWVNYWGNEGFELNGVASAAYTVAEWRTITTMVSVDSMRGQDVGWRGVLNDATAEGSAVWTRSSDQSTTYTPTPGSRLVNNSTNNVATFGGGSYSLIQSAVGGRTYRFVNLEIAVSGTQYTLDGSLVEHATQPRVTYTGEVRIINNGTLVARLYGIGGNEMRVEVLVPLIAL